MTSKTKAKISFATNAYTDGTWTLERALEAIAEAGYQGAEVLADKPLLWVPEMPAGTAARIRRSFEHLGLGVSGVNGFTCSGYWGDREGPPGQNFGPGFTDPNPELRRFKLDYTRKVLDFAAEVGAPGVTVGAGYPPEGMARTEAWKLLVDGLWEVVHYAEKLGVCMNLEYEPDLLVGTAEHARKLLSEIDSSSFGLNFDIGHSWVADEEVIPQIREFADRIHGVHVEDIASDEKGRRVHYHLVPGDGEMPLAGILQTLFDVGYDGFLTVELYNHSHHPVEVTRESIKRLRELLPRDTARYTKS